MAARFWRIVLAARLLAAGAVGVCAAAFLAAPGAALVAGAAAWMGMSVTLVAVSLVVARRGARSDGSRAAIVMVLRILCLEAMQFELMLFRMAAEPVLAWLDRVAGRPSAPPAQVILVHGIACNRAIWRPLLAALRAAGIERVDAVNLEPPFADIDALAQALLEQIEGLRASGRPVVIVAHSMGGLVARAAARIANPGVIGRSITLGTPHHGTEIACRFGWPSTRQMCRGSPWLLELNGLQEGRLGVPLTSLYSLDDNLIAPATSAAIRGARLIELRGLGHLSLLSAPAVLEGIVAELRN